MHADLAPYGFHPAVAAWFGERFGSPTAAQHEAWPAIGSGVHTLIAAPTGSGKTLAAFLAAINELAVEAEQGELPNETRVVYVSPLKALSNDIEKNLREPLQSITRRLAEMGADATTIRAEVRTGDTPQRVRAAMRRRPPHILVTTPESLYILLTSASGRKMLSTTTTVIVDEIHAVIEQRRGAHLALSLERLSRVCERPPTRVGLSATQNPIATVADFLVGEQNTDVRIVDTGLKRDLDLAVCVPASPLSAVMSLDVWDEVCDRLAELISTHETTLVFVNTRRLSERIAAWLSERVGEELVMPHHGSLSKERRLRAEQALKNGELRALVATASLELGIDIGSVDLVVQIGSNRSISSFMQRAGRANHTVGGVPKARIFPTSRDELIESSALLVAARSGELDLLEVPQTPLDILAQQIVAECADEKIPVDELFECVTRAMPYRSLTRGSFDDVLTMLADGFATSRGRRGALIHLDRINHTVRGRRGARMRAILGGGAIPDNADYDVVLEPTGLRIGSLNEDFAVESMAGDIFQLGNTSWRILRVEGGRVRVESAAGLPPNLPFWLGEAPSRTRELSQAVADFRNHVAAACEASGEAPGEAARYAAISAELQDAGLEPAAAEQAAEYVDAGSLALTAAPDRDTVILERFFDESGGMQLVLHSVFGSRINRAWGLALRKKFCKRFNFELQAAANEDAIVLSLGETHSFPLEEVFSYLSSRSVRETLIQAMLDSPMFQTRWRWNATRSLAIARNRNGKRVPANLIRMQAEDLISVAFPDQIACQDNITGPREIPDHPLVTQTIEDCLTEAMDIDGLEQILLRLEQGDLRTIVRDLREPSPFAAEILNARPYAFLDDAPLEERRTNAVRNRRWMDPALAAELATFEPQAIEAVRAEAFPDARDADELHDALMVAGFLTRRELLRVSERCDGLLASLSATGRVAELDGAEPLVCAEELRPQLERVLRGWAASRDGGGSTELEDAAAEALVEVMRARLSILPIVTPRQLCAPMEIGEEWVDRALLQLENEGYVFRGRYEAGVDVDQWCERALLARIHRYSISSLRERIAAVPVAQWMRFALRWQGVDTDDRAEGPEALRRILTQLQGVEAPAGAWESEIIPTRMHNYDSSWLDALCHSGALVWLRLSPPAAGVKSAMPIRSTPIALLPRASLDLWRGSHEVVEDELSHDARRVFAALRACGALFFPDLVRAAGGLRSQVEDGLAELAARGVVSSDGFAGLRALIGRSMRTARGHRNSIDPMEAAGRWSLIHASTAADDARVEAIARALLQRWGVLFRPLAAGDANLPPWRLIFRALRRLEDRGEVRGGRFVEGIAGEQFALPDAVAALRHCRAENVLNQQASISAADPLNLTGRILAGERVPARSANRVLMRNGVPVAARVAGEILLYGDVAPDERWKLSEAVVSRDIPRSVRSYLGRIH